MQFDDGKVTVRTVVRLAISPSALRDLAEKMESHRKTPTDEDIAYLYTANEFADGNSVEIVDDGK